jgi:hypothetical protein
MFQLRPAYICVHISCIQEAEPRYVLLRDFSWLLGGQRLHEWPQLPGGATRQLISFAVQERSAPNLHTTEVAGDQPRELLWTGRRSSGTGSLLQWKRGNRSPIQRQWIRALVLQQPPQELQGIQQVRPLTSNPYVSQSFYVVHYPPAIFDVQALLNSVCDKQWMPWLGSNNCVFLSSLFNLPIYLMNADSIKLQRPELYIVLRNPFWF